MYTVSCAQRKITGEWTTWMPFYTDFFVWITACHGRVHEKWPKDTEETWIPTEQQREQAKSGYKTVFWALIGTNQDESAFLGRRVGRRVSVSKSGLSRRERDGWQVCIPPVSEWMGSCDASTEPIIHQQWRGSTPQSSAFAWSMRAQCGAEGPQDVSNTDKTHLQIRHSLSLPPLEKRFEYT